MTLSTSHRSRPHTAAGLALLTVLAAPSAHAGFIGSDNFNDNVSDPTKWSTTAIAPFNNATMAETNGRLEYGSPESSFSVFHQGWILNDGSYTNDWFVQVDAHVDNSASSPQSHVGLAGFQLFKHNANQTQANFSFVNNAAFGSIVIGDSIPDITTLNGRVFDKISVATVDAALRLEFDGNSKVMRFLYDIDGGLNGYVWQTLIQADLDDPALTWNMAPSDTFDLYLVAASSSPTGSGEITFDNFIASVPEPSSASLLLAAGLGGGMWRRRSRQMRA